MSSAAAFDLGARSAPGVGFDANFVVDFAPLLAPISEEAPCGPLIRYGELWSRIQEARR
jgi:hypothetical protein